MKKPETIILATHNQGKVREFQSLFTPLSVRIESAADHNLSEPDETGATFHENAILKARAAYTETGMPSLADDSGLCVRALNDDPGIYSARWAGPNKDFNHAMQRILDGLNDTSDRSAAFVAVLAYIDADGHEHYFEGRVEGVIAPTPMGNDGFGYDPLFIPAGEKRSFGEMSLLEKQAHNHRSNAFAAFKQKLLA